MQVGVVFPQTEIGSDPSLIRDFAQTAEQLGYSHILAFDHVLGAEHANRNPELRRGAYDETSAFHEVFALFAYFAGVTSTIGLATGVLVLPQRQTALVAKQAAEIQILSGGRLRLGVGTGWNHVEFEALGVPWDHRGSRQAEQVELLRRLWSEPLVDVSARWHRINRAGLNPLPSKTIPVWFGGFGEHAFRRGVAMGDGFILAGGGRDAFAALDRIMQLLRASGRSPSTFGIEAIVDYGPAGLADAPSKWRNLLARWDSLGVSHISLHTMRAGLDTPGKHIQALRHYAEAIGLK